MKKSVGIIGAGPGGLAAGVLLQKNGYQVEIFEAADRVGGRNARVELGRDGEFKFDTGPTFFLMPKVLEEIFESSGRKLSDYVRIEKVDPLYRLDFGDGTRLDVSSDPRKMAEGIAEFSQRDADSFWSFRERQRNKFDALLPALQQPYSSFLDFLKSHSFAALPYLNLSSVYDELSDYFEDERVRLAFTFQAKYLGMSPFECPSIFTMLPHIEHHLGVWHPIGGCNRISKALSDLFVELGGELHLSSPVEKCLTAQRSVSGLRLKTGVEKTFDFTVMNADFGYGMTDLVAESERVKYKNAKIEAMKYSCSTFMMYLGLDRKIDWPHHAIYFSPNYRKNVRELCETFELSEEPSFYIHNPSLLDETLAPQDKSAVYILVPVPNLKSSTEWNESTVLAFKEKIYGLIVERTGTDIRSFVEVEKTISPLDWQSDYKVYLGATFSLAHSLDQMLNFRPHNEFEDIENLYLVGGGTHPGSGLPTILESGKIAASLIEKKVQKRRGLADRWLGAIEPLRLEASASISSVAPIAPIAKWLADWRRSAKADQAQVQ